MITDLTMFDSGDNNIESSSGDASSFSQMEESLSDLKNTPSNIARLEDAVEQCKGRRKYLAQTRSPSDGDDVRWYFCKIPLGETELAASFPQTEIVGKSDYFRFSIRDSLALEASFLKIVLRFLVHSNVPDIYLPTLDLKYFLHDYQREDELLSHWWKEYAECNTGPNGSQNPKISSYDSSNNVYSVDEERVGVPVKGGLYEVDLFKRHCFPVYWSGENWRVLKAHWFARKGDLDWLPLREDIAEQLELAYRCQVWHRRTFQPSGLFAARVDIQCSTEGLHALFTGEDDTWEAWLGNDSLSFSFSLGRGNKFQLRRGFSSPGSLRPTKEELRQQKEEEMDDYCSQVPVGHLVFMVHGIGQRLERANLVDDVGQFRHMTASLAEEHLSSYQLSTQRVLYIPCQWRKGLQLSSESAVENITLSGVRNLRITLSATVHDVLYYMSPIYCQDIINSVSNQLNKLYQKFLKRNPGYNGKVSLYGHSLGSVLSYDILCHQDNSTSAFQMNPVHVEGIRESQSHIDINKKNEDSLCIHNIDHPEDNIDIGKICHSESYPNDMMLEDSNGDRFNVAIENSSSNVGKFSSTNNGKQPDYASVSGKCFQKDDSNSECTFSSELVKNEIESTILDTEVYNDDAQKVYIDKNKDDFDQDRLISLLKKEVECLKESIAKFEQANNYLLSEKMSNSCSFEKKLGRMENREDKATCSQPLYMKQTTEQDLSRKNYTPCINYTKLDFTVDTFFAVGSPLGVFLALRNIRIGNGGGKDYWQDERISEELPACRQMFNIFHPFDPVAYRIEPLVCKEFTSKAPVIVPHHRGGKRLHVKLQEINMEIDSRSQAVRSKMHSTKMNMLGVFRSRNAIENDDIDEFYEKENPYGCIMMKRLTGSENGRVDHMLQSKTFQHPYISALGSHTNYWRDPDTALFILKHLYRDIPEEPDICTEEENDGTFGGKLFFQKEVFEEDFPLTFSDKVVIREFSRKLRNSMPKDNNL